MKLSHRPEPTAKRIRGCKRGRKLALSNEQIAVIRDRYEAEEETSFSMLAQDYKVNTSTIRQVIQYLGAYA